MEAKDILKEIWGIEGDIKKLEGYEDSNYYVKTETKQYLLKISKGKIDHLLDMQVKAMEHFGYEVKVEEEETFTARLLPWLTGKVWANYQPKSPEILFDLGVEAARHYRQLANFEHPATHRKDFRWDLAQAEWIKEYQHLLTEDQKEKVDYFLQRYIDIEKKYATLPRTTIHNDLNDYNILVANSEVAGFIDYGDMCHSQRINEVAILLAYGMMDFPQPLDAAFSILKGFTTECQLTALEIECLFTLIAMRLCVSLVSSTLEIKDNPENEYLLISQAPALKLLDKLYETSEQFATYKFKASCGLPIIDRSPFDEWSMTTKFSKVCDFDKNEIYALDLTVGSQELGHEATYNDASQHEQKINILVKQANKSVAIGAYNEVRPLYSSDDFTEIGNEGQRWRTVHIGLDFFNKAGSEVYAFAEGEVLAIAYNDGDKNYGNTVILKHEKCCTLYGHLSSWTLENLQIGQKISSGDLIGYFGEVHENGNWAPHLHFQIILDMLDHTEDYPGVCFIEDREVWTAICPDPRPFLGIDIPSREDVNSASLHAMRKRNLGRSYSLSYKDPLHIVRAHDVYLYDETGRKYLDCVNNVPHVGHQNIRVVEANMKQSQLLNTNTRYLHENIVTLAENLLSTLPKHLKICHFVNSGSEANELALRMARVATQREGIVAMEHGYHGNTGLCVDISSYKFDGNGGAGQKGFVQIVPMPDPVRHSGLKVFQLDSSKEIPAAFIHESILSCGGQVLLPEDFFSDLYGRFREKGMIMIADEVQTGLGRIGSHMWAFEAEDIKPDIVTIGKPFGNGHPLAAVVCTEELADAFHNGMEYFNTFGGNPVSCAIGLAVLEEIENRDLQEHAFVLGQWIKEQLEKLQEMYPIIADVRGRGLFLGWEFADPETKAPLAKKADFFVNEMRRHGILLSTDGPLHNVIKFKPPMTFSKQHAEYMLEWMEKVLAY